MLKKLVTLFIIISIIATCCGCGKNSSNAQGEEVPPWVGTYVMVNDETGEFKVLTVNTATVDDVVYEFKSVRAEDEFTGILKTKSKKYAVCNAGDRCLKFDLKSSSTVIAVDDIWTSKEDRNENWSGKYEKLEENEKPKSFGDVFWNGKYTCEKNSLSVEVYAIKTDMVLLSYTDPENDEKINLQCNISDKNEKNAKYEDEFRTIELEVAKNNKTIIITETLADEEESEMSGRYEA